MTNQAYKIRMLCSYIHIYKSYSYTHIYLLLYVSLYTMKKLRNYLGIDVKLQRQELFKFGYKRKTITAMSEVNMFQTVSWACTDTFVCN